MGAWECENPAWASLGSNSNSGERVFLVWAVQHNKEDNIGESLDGTSRGALLDKREVGDHHSNSLPVGQQACQLDPESVVVEHRDKKADYGPTKGERR